MVDAGSSQTWLNDENLPPPAQGEVVIFGEGQSGTISRAYPLEDKYAVKPIGSRKEVRGPNGTFFYFKRSELQRALAAAAPSTFQELSGDNSAAASGPPAKQARLMPSGGGSEAVGGGSMETVKQVLTGLFPGEKRLEGRVKWYSRDKGFGKITPKLPGEEVFVHKNGMEGGPDGAHAQAIAEGVLVSYELQTSQVDGKPCASAVQVEGIARATLAQVGGLSAPGSEAAVRRLLTSSIHVGIFQEKGVGKSIMEDRYLVRTSVSVEQLGPNCKKALCAFFGVFDGHSGPSCSDFVSTNLDKNFFDCLRHQSKRDVSSEMSIRSALMAAFRTTEHNYFQYINRLDGGAQRSWATAGSTACTACLFGPDEDGRLRLAIANAGDSRAVLGKRDGRALRLSEDHQPDVPSERKRIEMAGASVTHVHGISRIVLPSSRGTSYAGLSVSRGFGDLEYKQPANVVSAVPDVTFRTVDLQEDCFVVIGSDGIWNPLQDLEATRVIAGNIARAAADDAQQSKSKLSKEAAQQLVSEAHKRDGSDDKTAMVIWFGDVPDLPASSIAGPDRSRRSQGMMAPAQASSATGRGRSKASDDMFAGMETKAAALRDRISSIDRQLQAAATQAAPQPASNELSDLDDLFSQYASELTN
eukprot:TRINITY_DN52188_c0_g1_i1.p1 TRINITY_DN52188_c0_g1~~TRINITY_DN52188_c0_g1_i1.p1  ORF type:complete len:642 (-),score=134.49 TRINITY_DN52188_c0_g1_i1:54-1979(-)